MDDKWLLIELPTSDYQKILDLQLQIVDAKKENELAEDVLIMVEHFPVFTLGNRGGMQDLKVSKNFLASKKVPIIQTKRGGNITHHGPGQLVAYPILSLSPTKGMRVTELVCRLEQVMIDTARNFSILAERVPDKRGIWVGPKKIGSLGLSIKKGVSYHGLALNVCPDLTPFDWINPCGLTDAEVTSLEKESLGPISIRQAREAMKDVFMKNFAMTLRPMSLKKALQKLR